MTVRKVLDSLLLLTSTFLAIHGINELSPPVTSILLGAGGIAFVFWKDRPKRTIECEHINCPNKAHD